MLSTICLDHGHIPKYQTMTSSNAPAKSLFCVHQRQFISEVHMTFFRSTEHISQRIVKVKKSVFIRFHIITYSLPDKNSFNTEGDDKNNVILALCIQVNIKSAIIPCVIIVCAFFFLLSVICIFI